MEIGERIKERRKELGLSAEQVADKLGVSPATIYRYESNDILNMRIDKLEPIALVLKTTPAYLMGWDESKTNDDDALTLSEQEHIKKYRTLDEYGKDMVDTVLDKEYNRLHTPKIINNDKLIYGEAVAFGGAKITTAYTSDRASRIAELERQNLKEQEERKNKEK